MMTMMEQWLPVLLQQEVVDAKTAESFSYLDVGGYNYAESRYAMDHDLHPQRVIVGSETMLNTAAALVLALVAVRDRFFAHGEHTARRVRATSMSPQRITTSRASAAVTLRTASAEGTVSTEPAFSRFMLSPAKACGLPRNSETSIWSSDTPCVS